MIACRGESGVKNKKNIKTRVMIYFILVMLLLNGCSVNETLETQTSTEPVVIPVIFRVNPENNIGEYRDMVEDFNRLYEGKYYVDVEWMTDTASGYREKIKTLNALEQLPAIITDACFDRNFYELCIANNRFVDLAPFIEQSEEWRECISNTMLEECREEDGGIYLSPLGNPIHSSAGIFYNKELFEKAGIESFPSTWQGFLQCLDILQKEGITPFAMHGAGSYWSSMLVATAYMTSDKDGEEFLNQSFPDSYNNDSMRKLLYMMSRMYKYTYRDALEIDFTTASQRFYSGEVAMIANGYWMMKEMEEDVKQRTGFATFPGNAMMGSARMSAWAIVSGYSDEVTKGAVEFLKYRAAVSQKEMQEYMEQEASTLVEKEYKEAINSVQRYFPNFQLQWEPEIYNSFFTEKMPLYLDGTYNFNYFLKEIDNKLIEIRNSKG